MLHKDLKFITDCIRSQSISWCEPFGCETQMNLWKKKLVKLYVILYQCCDEVKLYFPIINKSLCYFRFIWWVNVCISNQHLSQTNLMYLTSSENVYCTESLNTYENRDRLDFGTGCYTSIQKYISRHIVPKQLKTEIYI